jgi:hypothetical protein
MYIEWPLGRTGQDGTDMRLGIKFCLTKNRRLPTKVIAFYTGRVGACSR